MSAPGSPYVPLEERATSTVIMSFPELINATREASALAGVAMSIAREAGAGDPDSMRCLSAVMRVMSAQILVLQQQAEARLMAAQRAYATADSQDGP